MLKLHFQTEQRMIKKNYIIYFLQRFAGQHFEESTMWKYGAWGANFKSLPLAEIADKNFYMQM